LSDWTLSMEARQGSRVGEKSGFLSLLLGCVARNLLIIGLQHDRTGWLDNHQLALIKGVGAIQKDPLFCLTKFDMQLATIRLLARYLFKEALVV
jgi:hypothetical protein